VASEYAALGEKPKVRMVRDHRFASVDNSAILIDNIDIKSYKESEKFIVEIHNKSPHAIPTGYGLREIIITAQFYVGKKKINQKQEILTTQWLDKKGNLTLPFMATTKSVDTRLAAKSSKKYLFDIPKGATKVKYILSYRFIGKRMAKIIAIKDPFFNKEYKVTEGGLDL